MLSVDLGNDIFMAYGTPILRHKLQNSNPICEGLKQILLDKERMHPEFRTGKRVRSNQGGWRSKEDLLKWPGLEISLLKDEIHKAIATIMKLAVGNDTARQVELDLASVAWANINRDGDYNVFHVHPGNHWSGVFYVSVGDPDPAYSQNGYFEFYDPRGAAMMNPIPDFPFGYTMPIEPEQGIIMVFPSWMNHAVHPFRGAGERISISFNTVIKSINYLSQE